MPSVGVKFYSVFFKLMLKHRLHNRIQNTVVDGTNGTTTTSFGVTSRPEEEPIAAANPVFTDGVATKDIHIDPLTSLSLRIFLPDTCLNSPDSDLKIHSKPNKLNNSFRTSDSFSRSDSNHFPFRRHTSDPSITNNEGFDYNNHGRNSNGSSDDDIKSKSENGAYRGYSPASDKCRKLSVILQFHGGDFVSGSKDTAANDFFCRRIAKLCDVIVLAVGYCWEMNTNCFPFRTCSE